jgi:DNA-directed RNA polymerase
MEIPDIDLPGIFPSIGNNALPFMRPIEPLDILDPSQVIALENPLPEERERKRNPKSSSGIPCEKKEVLATFNACINVGMVGRAQVMLEQITSQLERESPVLINAHNSFLKALLDRSKEMRDLDPLKGTQDLKVFFMWYENRMKGEYDLFGDSTTFALLLKASLMIESKDGKKMYVLEYAGRWKEVSEMGEVLGNTLLTDDDVIQIAKVGLK